MKKVTIFYMETCGYCVKAARALEELRQENPAYASIELERIDETKEPEKAEQYDYWAVPAMFVGNDKVFEAHIGMSYEDIKNAVRTVLNAALESE